jgi:hypothetical protein
MAFIRTHLVSLLSGVAGLAFVAIAVVGMMSDRVEKQMATWAELGAQLRSLMTNPKNEEIIAAEAARGERFKQEYAETVAVAEQINRRAPLLDGVFPVPVRARGTYDFRDAYRQAVSRLATGPLAGGDLPTEADIQEAARDIEELAEREAEERGEAPAIARTEPRPAVPAPPIPGLSVEIAGMRKSGMAAGTRAPGAPATGVAPADPRRDPRARAAIARARSIRCYVTTDPTADTPSFHISPIALSTEEPPLDQMWYAQVGLWIQQDIVAAIAELNEQAARRLKPEDVYVENMPVKRLVAIRIGGYVTEHGIIDFPLAARTPGRVGVNLGSAFTGRVSDSQFDVLRFTLQIVVDQRALLSVIDAITRQNFYECIGCRFEVVRPSDPDYAAGYLYGSAPVVRATLDFEAYMSRRLYEELFPREVRVALGISDKGRPGRKP